MLSSAALRKTGSGWEFASEEALEDFVEVHLQSLLGLTVIKRQFTVNEQRCDIIAVDENKRLVVLELKNGEDRYVVQQLTRYYDALLEHKHFADRVDYAQPVRLIAIAPKFHRDNFTDRKYHGLFFQFLQFAIVLFEDNLNLQLKDVDTEQISQVEFVHQQTESTDRIPSPPKAFIKLLNQCELSQQQEILKIRDKILSFDKRMQEITDSGSIKYGNGNTKTSKFCAELCSDSKGNLILFLWLPLKGLTSKTISRARVWTDWNDNALIEGYVSRGIGAKVSSNKKVIANQTEKVKQNIKNIQQCTFMHSYFIERELLEYINSAIKLVNKSASSQILTYEEMKYIDLSKDVKDVFIKNKIIGRYPEVVEIIEYLEKRTCKFTSDQLIDLSMQKWLERL
ncbi:MULTISPECIES: endonuclease NucS domain-containing protein [unclassified Microcoleus]|uniref:endonuclease NucS domain-containing protein n=1 Tax=unclassified Microcoleus TaxID=2642155 RepID=UPI002FCFCEB7